jgi:diaminopimelate decarboxylase
MIGENRGNVRWKGLTRGHEHEPSSPIGGRARSQPDSPALTFKKETLTYDVLTVVGCLCTPLDLLGEDVRLADAQIGDSILVFQAGACSLTAGPTAFLDHPLPSEVLV